MILFCSSKPTTMKAPLQAVAIINPVRRIAARSMASGDANIFMARKIRCKRSNHRIAEDQQETTEKGSNPTSWAAIFRVTSRRILRSYLGEHRKEGLKTMNDQDSGTIIITFLLLLPWLGRVAVSAVAIWREHIEARDRKAKHCLAARWPVGRIGDA